MSSPCDTLAPIHGSAAYASVSPRATEMEISTTLWAHVAQEGLYVFYVIWCRQSWQNACNKRVICSASMLFSYHTLLHGLCTQIVVMAWTSMLVEHSVLTTACKLVCCVIVFVIDVVTVFVEMTMMLVYNCDCLWWSSKSVERKVRSSHGSVVKGIDSQLVIQVWLLRDIIGRAFGHPI